jgi:hypothetical protein
MGVVLAVVLAGLFLPGVPGAIAIGLLAALLVWLLAFSWSVATTGLRMARLVIIVALIGYAVWKIVH